MVVRHDGPLASAPTATVSQGSVQVVNSEVRCALGQLGAGQSATVQISVAPANQEALRLVAEVTETEADSRLIDNFGDKFVLVHPLIPASCACSCYTNSTWPTPDPLLESWYKTGSGQYARVITNSGGAPQTIWKAVQEPPLGAMDTRTNVGPVYADIQKIQDSGDSVYVTAHGLASHVMGPWYCDLATGNLFPNTPANHYTTNRIPRNPTPNDGHPVTPLGAMGVWVNGTAIYNMLDGFFYDRDAGDDAKPGATRSTWNRDAWFSEHVTFDPALYHQEQDGEYHAHANPLLLRLQRADNVLATTNSEGVVTYSEDTNHLHHSPILGWAWDGHPIYGPYGYSEPTNAASVIRRMVSGYVLRNGQYGTTMLTNTGRTTIPAWTRCDGADHTQISSTNDYGPEFSGSSTGHCNAIEWALGRYAEDYAYLGDIWGAPSRGAEWDLDRFNGRCCKTPEFPEGTYAYFVTLDENHQPAFPYIIGWQYCSQTNGGPVVGPVPAGATTVYSAAHVGLVGQNLEDWLKSQFQLPIVLQWNSREGGSYRVLSSADLQQWTPLSPAITATGTRTTISINPGVPPPPRQFFKVKMESDGAPPPPGNQ